jgi:hypothetical protein
MYVFISTWLRDKNFFYNNFIIYTSIFIILLLLMRQIENTN